MKTSEAFKSAREVLWDGQGNDYYHQTGQCRGGKERFVCLALRVARIPNKKAEDCRKIIERLLGDHETLEDWLIANGHVDLSHMDQWSDDYVIKIQTTRRAWLDHLIAHYQAKGD